MCCLEMTRTLWLSAARLVDDSLPTMPRPSAVDFSRGARLTSGTAPAARVKSRGAAAKPPRTATPFPIAYPTAARPQAWAAGTPVLLLQVLLGLQPNRQRQTLETLAPIELPSWAGTIRLSGVRVFGRSFDVHVTDGKVRVEQS